MKRVLFLFTGGTISMKIDAARGGAVPALSGQEILASVAGLPELVQPEVIDFARLPGPHMTPELMFSLSEVLNANLDRDEIDAAVITHGTDTLEETAYLLDLRLRSTKPVAIVGALRNSSELGWDGPRNLHAAVRTVVTESAIGRGVLVVLNDRIHAAAEATKTHTHDLDAFTSPGWGPLGVVDQDQVVWQRPCSLRQHIETSRLEPRVDLFTMAAGMDDRLLRAALHNGSCGMVLEGTGRGNVPPAVLPGLQEALDNGLPVVITSRCGAGRVLDTYAYEGSGTDLRRRGVLFGGSLPGPKARIKLMLALGASSDAAFLRSLFA